MGVSGPPGSRVPRMDLGLSIGGGELGKRSCVAASREAGMKRSRGDQWMPEEEGEGHPCLQLELKLSWPNGLGSSYQHGHSSSPKATPAATDSAPTSEGGGVGVNGPPKPVDGCDNYNETGPSSSTSRTTAAGRARGRCSDEDVCPAVPRKKLRLTKEQSCYLEESFKENATLNPKQKLAIAKKLNLRPRQVEVWFQNRRARTKLKQTEAEYEYMKRCCESLTEENRRLHREIQELRALKAPVPHQPATTLSICPSCERAAVRVMGGRRAAIPLKLRGGYPTMAYPVS